MLAPVGFDPTTSGLWARHDFLCATEHILFMVMNILFRNEMKIKN